MNNTNTKYLCEAAEARLDLARRLMDEALSKKHTDELRDMLVDAATVVTAHAAEHQRKFETLMGWDKTK
jgi:hypothetical protein